MSAFKKLLGLDNEQPSQARPHSGQPAAHRVKTPVLSPRGKQDIALDAPQLVPEAVGADEACSREAQDSKPLWQQAQKETAEASKAAATALEAACHADKALEEATRLQAEFDKLQKEGEKVGAKAEQVKESTVSVKDKASAALKAEEEEKQKKEKAAQLNRAVHEARKAAAAAQQEVKDSEAVVQGIKDQTVALESREGDAARHADNVKAEQERLSAEAMVAIAAAGDKEKVVEAILREYNEAAREVEEKEKELLQAKEAAKTKAKQLDIARTDMLNTEKKGLELQGTANEALTNAQKARDKANAARKDLEAAQAELKAAEDQLQAKKNALWDADNELREILHKYEAIEKELPEAHKEFEDKKAELQKAQVAVREATARYVSLQQTSKEALAKAKTAEEQALAKEEEWQQAQELAEEARAEESRHWEKAKQLGDEGDEKVEHRIQEMHEHVEHKRGLVTTPTDSDKAVTAVSSVKETTASSSGTRTKLSSTKTTQKKSKKGSEASSTQQPNGKDLVPQVAAE